MKLFILKGFESGNYQTYTIFYATSKEKAEELCAEFYHNTIAQLNHWKKVDAIRENEVEAFHKKQDDELARLEEVKKVDNNLCNKDLWLHEETEGGGGKTTSKIGIVKNWRLDFSKEYYDAQKEYFDKYPNTSYRSDIESIIDAFYSAFNEKDAEEAIEDLIDGLVVYSSDTLHHIADTDGD